MTMRMPSVTCGFPAVLAALLLGNLAGCAPTISAKVMKPAEVNVSAYHNVAVTRFQGAEPQGTDISRWTEQALAQVRHDGKPYFKLVARDQLEQVMKEQSLQLTGAINSSQTSKIGQVLGVDAIITGNVSSYRTEDASFNETRTESYKCGEKRCSREHEVPCTQRDAYVSFNVNFIGVETGVIEVSDSEESQLVAKQCKDTGDLGGNALAKILSGNKYVPMQSPEKMLRQAADKSIASFVRKITPHYVTQTVSLKKGDDDAPMFFYSKEEQALSDTMNAGIGYAKSGVWQQAIVSWEEAVKQKPTCAACHYNLGFGYEMKGDLQKAKEMYEKAAQLRASESDYSQAVGRIHVMIADAEAVARQMKGRGKDKQ